MWVVWGIGVEGAFRFLEIWTSVGHVVIVSTLERLTADNLWIFWSSRIPLVRMNTLL